MEDAAPPPTDVEVDRERGVTLTWPDGHVTRFALAELRVACPCAFCRNLREAGAPVWAGREQELRVTSAELVGNWGLQLRWNDGHQTGIYTWRLLRDWCACPECLGS